MTPLLVVLLLLVAVAAVSCFVIQTVTLRHKLLPVRWKMLQSSDNTVYVTEDKKVSKQVLKSGDSSREKPLDGDLVELKWVIYGPDASTAVRSSDSQQEKFTFVLGLDPSEVVPGWEAAVKTMYVGEDVLLSVDPSYAFGDKGLPGIIEPKAILHCKLQLVDIIPSLGRTYKTIDVDGTLSEEFAKETDMDEDDNKIVDNTIQKNLLLNLKKGDKDKIFDPSIHKIDPNLVVKGMSKGERYLWEETSSTMDIELQLLRPFSKDQLSISFQPQYLKVTVPVTREILLEGPLHGKVRPNGCMWSLTQSTTGSRLVLSLEKAHLSKDIWATVFDKDYLLESNE